KAQITPQKIINNFLLSHTSAGYGSKILRRTKHPITEPYIHSKHSRTLFELPGQTLISKVKLHQHHYLACTSGNDIRHKSNTERYSSHIIKR
ncbi:hypothetical protein V4S61_25035, partial [Citrobacter freundii]|uniref:hypothetical protein n=1 Tax=Citrobacter freundii TaxID=546 RepID=UPI002F96992C